MESKNVLADIIGSAIKGQARSKAILEDYAKVISQLTGVTHEIITERITKRTDELFEEIKASYQPTK